MNAKTIKCKHCQATNKVEDYPGPYRLTCRSCGTVLSSVTGKRWESQPIERNSDAWYANIVWVVFGIGVLVFVLSALAMAIGWGLDRLRSNDSDNIVNSQTTKSTSQSIYRAATSENTTPQPSSAPAHSQTKQSTPSGSTNSDEVIIQSPQPTSSSNLTNIASIIESSDVKFDENFAPTATIKLHNVMGKEIDQILFRFTFSNSSFSGTSIDRTDASECSSYVNYTVMLKPPYEQTIEIKVPDPQRKEIDKPNIFITKVRYYDGTIDTDYR